MRDDKADKEKPQKAENQKIGEPINMNPEEKNSRQLL